MLASARPAKLFDGGSVQDRDQALVGDGTRMLKPLGRPAPGGPWTKSSLNTNDTPDQDRHVADTMLGWINAWRWCTSKEEEGCPRGVVTMMKVGKEARRARYAVTCKQNAYPPVFLTRAPTSAYLYLNF